MTDPQAEPTPLNSDDSGRASPFLRELGVVLAEREPGFVRLEITVAEWHLRTRGIAHGGVIASLMDTAMGGAVMNTIDDGRRCATIEMQTRYHRPVATGTLTATAEVITAGRRVVHLRAETRDDDDRLVASATASFAIFEP